jgi:Flp pilus assembly protein TadB
MFRRTVTAPDGRTWTLGRRWLPRRRRFKKADLSDVGPDGGFDGFDADDLGIVGLIFAVVAAFFLAVFVALLAFNVIALALELLIVIVVALAGVVGRVVFRRPWIVFARHGKERLEWPVVGYLNSRRTLEDVAGRLRSGARLEPAARDRG